MKKIWRKMLVLSSLSLAVAGPTFCDFFRPPPMDVGKAETVQKCDIQSDTSPSTVKL